MSHRTAEGVAARRRGRTRAVHWLIGLAVVAALASSTVAEARTEIQMPTAYGRVPTEIYALQEPNLFAHNVGLLTMQITNLGIFGNPFSNSDLINAQWRGGEYLFFSGLWVGAIGSDAEPHVSAAGQVELRPQLEPVWTIYESFEGVKNGARLSEADPESADDDRDGEENEDFHDGLDNDGDGLVDEDFAAVGQQMLSCTYRDDTPESIAQNSDHVPLNITVRQRSFQWSTQDINEFVGIDFEIENTGDQRLKDVYLGFFSDSDAGPKTATRYWTDDLVGVASIDTSVVDPDVEGPCSRIDLEIDTAFMWDAPDNGTTITGGDVEGVFGSLFLGHTTDDTGVRAPQTVGLTTVVWFASSGQNADPQNDDERYQLLASEQIPRRNETRPDDYRYVVAAGPFAQLNPGESLNFQTAYVIGEGHTGFRANAVTAQRVFNGRFLNADSNEETGVAGRERCLFILEQGDEIVWDDPCDTLTTTDLYRVTPPCNTAGAIYVDGDCNPCTGIDGKEALINWVGTTAPPPPALNTDPDLDPLIDPNLEAFVDPAGDRKVILQWDNASELRPDPITGEDIFEGYRVWRVDNWQRPEGSLGPTTDEWMRIAEFRADRFPQVPWGSGAVALREIRSTMDYIDITEDGKEIYPIGRYSYEDTNGILNGKLYFYAVTAFGITFVENSVTGDDEAVELGGLPTATEAEAVVPRWDSVSGCDKVKVVPNPYRGGADWDLTPSDRDPTGTKIGFRNLPDGLSKVKIYTLSGDLVQEADHDGRTGDGTYFWNLVSRNGQQITSGMYLYSVESGSEICRGRFVIIK